MTRGRLKVTFSNIVLAMDFSEQAMCAFNFAFEIAKFYNAGLHIFHALPLSENDAYPSPAEIDANIQEAMARMKEQFAGLLAGVVDYSMESWEGAPHVEILKFARKTRADLIIMAHHSKEKDPEKAVLGFHGHQGGWRVCMSGIEHQPGILFPNALFSFRLDGHSFREDVRWRLMNLSGKLS